MSENRYYLITALKSNRRTKTWQRKSKQTEKDADPRGLHADGGHDDASYHVLHALYIFG